MAVFYSECNGMHKDGGDNYAAILERRGEN
jgi:hypothetical protein